MEFQSKEFFDRSLDLICIADFNGHFTYLNKTWTQLLGYSKEELSSKPFIEFIHPDDVKATAAVYQDLINGIECVALENRYLSKWGHYIWIGWKASVSLESQSIFAIARDITSTKKSEQALKALISSLDDIVIEMDEDGTYLNIWTSNEKLLFEGKESLLGKKLNEVLGEQLAGRFNTGIRECIKTGKPFYLEYPHTKNSEIWFSCKISPVHQSVPQDKQKVTLLIRDISEQRKFQETNRKTEAALIQKSKMASLGEMAGGIAHEINNPLAIIQAKAFQIRKRLDAYKLPDSELLKKDLDKIEETGMRINKIIRGLRSFSRNADNDPFLPTSLLGLLQDSLELCQTRFRLNQIHLRIDVDPHIEFDCRGAQIEQVIVNLLNNSFDAVVGTDTPWIHIYTEKAKDHFKVYFRDSGKGIAPEIAEKIMQPFFTTKEVGKGTGLGLSISKGIIEDHQGSLMLDTNSPNTTFIISLPYEKMQAGVGKS